MSTDPIADLVDHPPRDADADDPRLQAAIMAHVRRLPAPQPRRTARWWLPATAVALLLAALPVDGGLDLPAPDPGLLWLAAEIALAAGALLALALAAGRGTQEAAWKPC